METKVSRDWGRGGTHLRKSGLWNLTRMEGDIVGTLTYGSKLSPWTNHLWSHEEWSLFFKLDHACLKRGISHTQCQVPVMPLVFWAEVRFTPECWQQLQTPGETVCRHTASRSGYLVLTDRQQTHQVPVKVHQEAGLEVHLNVDNTPSVWRVHALPVVFLKSWKQEKPKDKTRQNK